MCILKKIQESLQILRLLKKNNLIYYIIILCYSIFRPGCTKLCSIFLLKLLITENIQEWLFFCIIRNYSVIMIDLNQVFLSLVNENIILITEYKNDIMNASFKQFLFLYKSYKILYTQKKEARCRGLTKAKKKRKIIKKPASTPDV